MPTYTPEQWRTLLGLDQLEDRENLPRGTLTAVMRAESGGKSTVVSPRGAGGLFQLMPATAASYKADRFDPQQAADAAAKELGSHYKRYDGDLQQTLAAWNWGSGNLQKRGMANAPAETRGFIPRVLKWITPGSAEAAEPTAGGRQRSAVEAPAGSKWDAILPGKPPSAATPGPPAAAASSQAETPASRWDDLLPGAPPTSPPAASPGAPAPPLPAGEPPVSSAPPVQGQEPPGAQTTVTPESLARAQGIERAQAQVDPTALTQRWGEEGAASTDPNWWSGADPASPRHQEWLQSSPMPSTRDVAREVGATGIEALAGVEGTIAGGAVGGVPGAVGGGIAGQSYGRRLTNRLGLREQEEPLATGFGLNLYPSDVANVGFGLLTGGPALFKAALAKTTAGKAIVSAEMTTREAYQAWQIERQRLQEAQRTGQQAKLNTALKDHATAEANYKRLVQQRNDLVAANKAEYDQAVTDFEAGVIQKHEAHVAKDLAAEHRQAAAIPEAQAIPKPYEAGTPSHVLYKEMRDTYSDVPLTLDAGKTRLAELRAARPTTLAGTPEPFPGEVETIAQGLESATGANVATIHEQLKKLGPLTRHKEGSIRGPARQLTGVLMDILETAPDAAGAIKTANQRFKREMSLADINDWLKPGHGVISTSRGKDTINPTAFVNKFRKEMGDSQFFRDSFTPDEAATIEANMRALAGRTPRMPTRVLERPTPQHIAEMPGRPTLKEVPEVPPIYPDLPAPGKPGGLTVPLEPPAQIPPEPSATTVWPRGKQVAPTTNTRVRIPPPKEAWTQEQWTKHAEQALAAKPGLGKQLMGAAAGAGGMAFALQRMGVPIATVNGALFTGAGLAAGAAAGRYGDWLLSRALLRDRYRPLLQEALMDGNTLNPYFYNAMLAALTPEDRKEYEREQRSTQKARR